MFFLFLFSLFCFVCFNFVDRDYTKRSGKYRHIFGDLHKPEKQFLEIPSPLTSGEGPYVKASAKFLAFAGGSVQKLYVKRLDAVGRFSSNQAHIALDCLKGKIWDFDWNPFIDTMVAMGDDNGKVAVAQVPKDGLKENLTSAAVDLGQVHGKKVTLVPFKSDLPISFSGALVIPFSNSTKYFFPSLKISTFKLLESALTTDTPTPCKPPETL